METEYVMEIARTIREQLVSLTPMPVIMSWGIEGFAATVYKDMPALQIEVNGRLHTGYVIVALNGADYYEVYLQQGASVECVNDEVCFDELGDVIDAPSSAVQIKPSTTDFATNSGLNSSLLPIDRYRSGPSGQRIPYKGML